MKAEKPHPLGQTGICPTKILFKERKIRWWPLPQNRRLGAEKDQLPCGSTGIYSGNCQETEIYVVRACHTSRQPLQSHPSVYLGGWATPWSADVRWIDNTKEWTSLPVPELLTRPSCRKDWKKISAESTLMSPRPVSYTHLRAHET